MDVAEDVDPSQQIPLDERADDEKGNGADDQGKPELARPSEKGKREIRAQHIEGRMGEVDNVEHAEYEGKTRRNEEEKGRVGKAMKEKDRNIAHNSQRLLLIMQQPCLIGHPPRTFRRSWHNYGLSLSRS